MNIKFLVSASILIALLIHVAIFSLFTFVFSIDAAATKPKFFFLGPILTQKDVKQTNVNEKTPQLQTISKNFSAIDKGLQESATVDNAQKTNPFAVRAINKPLTPQTNESHEKIVIKSTFEAKSIEDTSREKETEPIRAPKLEIQPYRPLQFRSP